MELFFQENIVISRYFNIFLFVTSGAPVHGKLQPNDGPVNRHKAKVDLMV